MFLAYSLLLAMPASAAKPDFCKDPHATVEECPDNYYPTPKRPGPQDPDLVPLLQDSKIAIDEERIAVKAWQEARANHRAAVETLNAAWIPSTKAKQDLEDAGLKYRDAASALRVRKTETDRATKVLLDAARLSYGVTPPKTDFSGDGISPGLVAWNPIFNRCEVKDAESGRCRLRTPKEEEQFRNEALARAARQGLPRPDPVSATTDPSTGQIILNATAFERPEPEEFGATIVHESVHWVDITSIGGYPLVNGTLQITPTEKFNRERLAHLQEAAFFRTLKMEHKALREEGTAEKLRIQIEITDKQGLTWADIRTKPQYRSWLSVQDHFQHEGLRDGDRGDFDVDSQTLRDIQRGAKEVDERLRAYAASQRREAEQTLQFGEDKRNAHVFMTHEAARCGLSYIDTWNTQFQVSGRPTQERIHMDWTDKETFKASLLIVAACHSPSVESPCNDAMETVAARWDDQDFRKAIELFDDSDQELYFCVAHIARRLSRPRNFKKIQAEAMSYRDWRESELRKPQPKPPAGGGVSTPRPPRVREDPRPVDPCSEGGSFGGVPTGCR